MIDTEDVNVSLLIGYIAIALVLIFSMVYLDYYGNPCRNYKPDASLIAEIDKTLHKDPKLSSLLGNNTYTINITSMTTYPYTENGQTKCLVTEVEAKIYFNKPIHVIEHDLIPHDYWTYALSVDVVLDYNNTLEISGQEIKIRG